MKFHLFGTSLSGAAVDHGIYSALDYDAYSAFDMEYEYDVREVDESGCNTDMTRRYAYSLGGSRAVDSAPLSKPKNTTILSSIQLDGTLRYTTFSGGTTVERFKRYLETDLLPHLNGNSVLIMDNRCSIHLSSTI